MNLKSLAIVLLITLGLALAALYALRSKVTIASASSSTSVAEVLGPSAAASRSLEIHTPLIGASLAEAPIPGLFALKMPKSAATAFAVTARGDALLRVLLETKLQGTATDGAADSPLIQKDASWVSFSDGTSMRRMTLVTNSAAQWLVQFDGSAQIYRADRDLSGLLAMQSLRQLADRRLGPGLTERTSDISIDSAGISLRLLRTPSGWAMTAPIVAPADRNTAETTRVILTDMSVERIEWDANPADPAFGFNAPRATIKASMPVGEAAGVSGRLFTVTLTIGAEADVAGDSVYALVRGGFSDSSEATSVFGPFVVAISKATLQKVPLAPAEYLSRTATTLERSDVRIVAIGPGGESAKKTYQLELTGWNADGAAIDPTPTADLDKLLTFLTSARADSVSMTQRRMMPLYTVRIGPRESPNHTVIFIGKGGEGWWIQNSHSELRFKQVGELETLLQRLMK